MLALLPLTLLSWLVFKGDPAFSRGTFPSHMELALFDELGALDQDDDATDDDDDEGIDSDTYEPGGSRLGETIRNTHPNGVMLGLGRTEAWLTATISARIWRGSQDMVMVGGGTGSYRTELKLSDYTYDFNIRSRGAFGGWRHYMGRSVPLFVQGGGGLSQWTGSVETRGDSGRSSLASKDDQAFAATGIYGEGGVGFAGYWANGFSIEYVLIGIGKTLYSNYSNEPTGSSDRALTRTIEFPVWFGLVNLSIGYYF